MVARCTRIRRPTFFEFELSAQIDQVFGGCSEIAEVMPLSEIEDCSGPDDNNFLALAADGKADGIVTDDED